MLHDRAMLVEVEKVARFPSGLLMARVRTAIGRATVRWCGDPAAGPGGYHVEWTVDEDIAWGRNAGPATGTGPEVRAGVHGVVLQGRLSLEDDGVAVLHLGDANVLLDLAGPLPGGFVGAWVEVWTGRERIALYPYQL